MLIKLTNPGKTHTFHADSVSTEVLASDSNGNSTLTRVIAYTRGNVSADVTVGDGGASHEAAYIMERGVTVDVIR